MQKLSLLALFVAVEIVLNRFLSINTIGTKIGFGFVPIALCAMCFGGLSAGCVAALADFLGAILFPIGPYHPGFTAVAFLMGLVYGAFIRDLPKYAPKERIVRVLTAAFINCVTLGLLVNTAWVAMLYGSEMYLGWFLYRLPEYFIGVPLRVVVIPALCPVVRAITRSMRVK